MNKKIQIVIFCLFILFVVGGILKSQISWNAEEISGTKSGESMDVPVKGMVTMLDLGAKECIPCKMMVPVLEKVEKKYRGRAAIVFIDVWKNKEPAKRFGVRVIPTQIFFDKNGKEVHRHVGFMGEKDIDQVFQKMGVN